jgi:molybdopterin biosynthesis enzyme MoaB
MFVSVFVLLIPEYYNIASLIFPQVCEKMMPGYGEQMRAIGLRYVPTAVLSRQTAGIRGRALILNLPGKPKAIRETIDEVFVSIPACISLLDPNISMETTGTEHPKSVKC